MMTRGLQAFVDRREDPQTRLVITHVGLLFGCAIPYLFFFVLTSGGPFDQSSLAISLCGVMILGVGDTAASLIGKAYGE